MMTEEHSSNPLTSPEAWNMVSEAYVADTVPFFENYASTALDLATLPDAREVLDVATGPGTLALLAAGRGHRVTAVDFAPDMLRRLHARTPPALEGKLTVELGDGQSLRFADASFDAAFSMFGLMFFADRAAGFRELHRVLRPTGRAVVSSWTPAELVPTIRALHRAIRGVLVGLAFGDGEAPLGYPSTMRQEMVEAGFQHVFVQEVSYEHLAPDVETFWESMSRASIPLVSLRKKLGDEWPAFSRAARARFTAEVGEGPVAVRWPAIIGVGMKPRTAQA